MPPPEIKMRLGSMQSIRHGIDPGGLYELPFFLRGFGSQSILQQATLVDCAGRTSPELRRHTRPTEVGLGLADGAGRIIVVVA